VSTIKVTVDRDGRIKMKVEGVQGESCTSLTEGLEAAIFGDSSHRELTSEFYQEPDIGVEEHI